MTVEGVTHALYLLWWVQYKGVSPAAVAAILAAGDIAITLLEVPTGRFADRFGHRNSLILGSAIQVVAMLLCWLAQGIPGLALASVCVALGDTFRSGADQALLYESCAATGQPEAFQKIETRTHSLELVGLLGMIAAGGLLVETAGFAAAWIAETLLAAVGLVLAIAMASPPRASRGDSDDVSPRRGTVSAGLLWLIAPAALIAGAATATAFMAQTGDEASPLQLTVLVGAITLAEAAGAAVARWFRPSLLTQYVLLATAAVCGIGMFAPVLFLPGVVVLSLLLGIAEPLRATAIQLGIEDRRAEAASWASATDSAVRTLSLLATGAARRRR